MVTLKTPEHLRTERRRTRRCPGPLCSSLLVAAPLWPKNGENLGTLLRTMDAVGGCVMVPTAPKSAEAVRRGNTIGDKAPVHWVRDPEAWLTKTARRVVAVELAHGAVPLRDVEPITYPTVLLLGHETQSIPEWALERVAMAIEIPMVGVGNSLNVAVAGSLAAYKLAGMA